MTFNELVAQTAGVPQGVEQASQLRPSTKYPAGQLSTHSWDDPAK